MKLNIEGRTALVTASSGGIGLEIARVLANEGAKVVINGRTQSSVEKAITNLAIPGAELVPLVADNGTAEGCATTISQVPEVDILVNNLGIYEAVGFFNEAGIQILGLASERRIAVVKRRVAAGTSRRLLRACL